MIVIGHRGARGEAPENTLAGFRHATAAGVRHFELDVRLAFDERPVVIHDDTVDRTTSDTGHVADFPASQLAAMDARRNTAGWASPTGIPTLEEVLTACPDALSWQLEIKSDTPDRIGPLVRRMAEIVTRMKLGAQITLTSLDTAVLDIARREAPGLARGYVAEQATPAPLATAQELGCSLLVTNWKITDDTLVRNAHDAGLPVSVWTVNDLVVAERLINLRVDSIITDFPSALLAHVAMHNKRAAQLNP